MSYKTQEHATIKHLCSKQDAPILISSLILTGIIIFLTIHQLIYIPDYSPAEAAALAASEEIARIVVDDPYFGLIGLFDGSKNKNKMSDAKNNKPVKSINTILATARLELILADLIGSQTLRNRALNDCDQARRAARYLEYQWQISLRPHTGIEFTDKSGGLLDPFQKGVAAYLRAKEKQGGHPKAPTLPVFHLGWQDKRGTTLTRIPSPYKYSFCTSVNEINDCYKPSVNASYKSEDFYFASVWKEPTLIKAEGFNPADGIHLSSLILAIDAGENSILKRMACSVPGLGQEEQTGAALIIHSAGHPKQTMTIKDILSRLASESQLQARPAGRDYLFTWLASAGGRCYVESVMSDFNSSSEFFSDEERKIVILQKTEDGRFSLLCRQKSPENVIAEVLLNSKTSASQTQRPKTSRSRLSSPIVVLPKSPVGM